MSDPSIEDYRMICRTMRHIPKRQRAKAKRNIKRFMLKKLDPNHENPHAALRAYRRMWEKPVEGKADA